MANRGESHRNKFSQWYCGGLAFVLAAMLAATGCDSPKPSLDELGELQFDAVPHFLDPEDVQRMIPDLPKEESEEDVDSSDDASAPASPDVQAPETDTEPAAAE
ncbi:MAG: hypothetical protein D6741_07545 [Planctomycetota bacterium]|nr:MAG: hypothetical protein D6741_07545 [Planctomycetota bacterium]